MVSTEANDIVQDLTVFNYVEDSYKKRIFTLKENIKNTNKKVKENSKWFAIELYDIDEVKTNPDIIDIEVKKIFGEDINFFVPCYREKIKEEMAVFWLFDGYFFIEAVDKIVNSSFMCFKESYIFKRILSRKGSKYKEVNGKEVNEIKKKLWNYFYKSFPKKGDFIVPKIGIFSGYRGEVIKIYKRDFMANVYFEFSTRKIEAPISFINLEKVR